LGVSQRACTTFTAFLILFGHFGKDLEYPVVAAKMISESLYVYAFLCACPHIQGNLQSVYLKCSGSCSVNLTEETTGKLKKHQRLF
jgi:hypothetical protein